MQAPVLVCFAELQRELGLAYLFIPRGLAIVEENSERVAVTFLGRLVEYGPSWTVLSAPAHAYTKTVLASIPLPDPAQTTRAPTLYQEGRRSPILPRGAGTEPAVFREVGASHFIAA